eukprot:TRINITY_DN7751_c0_g1_i1.p1 TRINITY_DN7751_c0_g1~~TRINITY_DN7751_c0_g1_i1.p1  ORF type:complete len:358 (-),score=86.79 TRINITY_DN7751_c0_g1_i1:28-1101(-)
MATTSPEAFDVFEYLLTSEINENDLNDDINVFLNDVYFKNAERLLNNHPIDLAILSGYLSNRLGFAFVSGYNSAIHSLLLSNVVNKKKLKDSPIEYNKTTCFCATEKSPMPNAKSINTTLQRKEENDNDKDNGEEEWIVKGKKSFVTLGTMADILIVIVNDINNNNEVMNETEKRKKLRAIMIEPKKVKNNNQLKIDNVGKELPFIPEVPHGKLVINDLVINKRSILPRDGYSFYLKSFRTFEDLHVFSSFLGYIFRIVKLWEFPEMFQEKILSVLSSLKYLAEECDLNDPVTHVVFNGTIKSAKEIISKFEENIQNYVNEPNTIEMLQRDRVLFDIANKSRVLRGKSAWKKIRSRL